MTSQKKLVTFEIFGLRRKSNRAVIFLSYFFLLANSKQTELIAVLALGLPSAVDTLFLP